MSEPDIPSQLCVGCAMCCDGTLYEHAKVAPGEEPAIGKAGLRLMQREGGTVFALPCQHTSCGRCMIYESRFDICRTFECSLLRSVKSGELSLFEAREKIATARQLLEKVIATDPGLQRVQARNSARALLAEQMAKSADAGRRAASERLLNIVALETYLSTWFRHQKSKEPGEMAAPPTKGVSARSPPGRRFR